MVAMLVLSVEESPQLAGRAWHFAGIDGPVGRGAAIQSRCLIAEGGRMV